MNDNAQDKPDLILARSVHKSYLEGSVATDVLMGCSVTIPRGSVTAITGVSGAGKSTLLHMLGLLDSPNKGEIVYDGREVSCLSEKERARIRNREFGFVFQAYHLINELTAHENVLLPAMMRPVGEYLAKRAEFKERAVSILTRFGLADRLSHKPLQLSGGERQRVAIARALMNSPKVLFCDEPTGNLDEENSSNVFDLLIKLREQENVTLIIVTHETSYADVADSVYRIHNGAAAKEK